MATASPIPPSESDSPDLESEDDSAEIKCVLVAQDDDRMRDQVVEWLTAAGYVVHVCGNAKQLIDRAHVVMPDMVIVDFTRPPLDSLEACRQLRYGISDPVLKRMPIIVLRSEPDDVDEIVFLELGADDYLGKPVQRRLLLAHVRALFRRVALTLARSEPDQAFLVSGDLMVDVRTQQVTRDGLPLILKRLEFDLLVLFMNNRGLVLGKDEIIARVWRGVSKEIVASLRVHLHRLREKIEPNPAEPSRIQTVAGRGYVFLG